MGRPPNISPADWMQMSDAERARWERWDNLSDDERTRILEREADAAAERDDPGASEVAAGPPAEPTQIEMLDRILRELENIRFRLGVLILFFVILPFVLGLIAGLIAALST